MRVLTAVLIVFPLLKIHFIAPTFIEYIKY